MKNRSKESFLKKGPPIFSCLLYGRKKDTSYILRKGVPPYMEGSLETLPLEARKRTKKSKTEDH